MKRFVVFFLSALFFLSEKLQAAPLLAGEPPKNHLIDFSQVFSASPVIYSALCLMSVAALGLWLYSLATIRLKDIMPAAFLDELRCLLQSEQLQHAHDLCAQKPNLLASLIYTGLTTRKMGPQMMIDAMKSEGKRASTPFWQKLTLLSDIVVIAPMLGLLGTVIGMFYAFYDVNRSIESINALFDGLGIAVGTTVFGLIVAIMAMVFATTLKYRLVNLLSQVENEALSLSALISTEHKS